METQVQKMNLEDFIYKFKPHMDKNQESFVTFCWTREEDTEAIDRAVKFNRIWTILDCDGKRIIQNGYCRVNRMDYLITIKPFTCKSGDIVVEFDEDHDNEFIYD